MLYIETPIIINNEFFVRIENVEPDGPPEIYYAVVLPDGSRAVPFASLDTAQAYAAKKEA
jgi:hypothetical protein